MHIAYFIYYIQRRGLVLLVKLYHGTNCSVLYAVLSE